MKKFLLSLALVLGLGASAYADTFEYDFTAQGLANTAEISSVETGVAGLTVTFGQGTNSNTPKYYTSGTAVRCYAGNTMTVAGDGLKITGLEITSVTGNAIATTTTVNGEAITVTDLVGSWAGSESYVTVSFLDGQTKGQVRVSSFKVTYEASDEMSVPTIALGNFNYVTLAHASADAIYYTLDGTDPTTASTKYTEPFELTAAATVKAIAVKDSETSAVASSALTPYAIYGGFASASSLESGTQFIVNKPITAIYKNGSNLWVKDSEGGFMLVYGYDTPALSNGDQIAALSCTYSPYSGLPEVKPVEFGTVTTGGTAVEPEEFGLDELGLTDANKYVKLSNVEIKDITNNRNFTIAADDVTIAGNNLFYSTTSTSYTPLEITAAADVDIVGFVSRNNNTLQFAPISITVNVQNCKAPTFSPNGGFIDSGTIVRISSATEGATIFFTIDGSEPTIESLQYSVPIELTSDITIKAIAVKEGFGNSEVSTASFTILGEEQAVATFDFTEPSSLNPEQETPEKTKDVSLDGVTLTNNAISLTFAKGKASTAPRLYNAEAGSVDLRMYKGNDEGPQIMSLTSTDVKSIDNIVFTTGGTLAFTVSAGAVEDKVWSPSADADVTAIDFTITATTRISTMVVVYTVGSSAVSSIGVDSVNAPVEYFNLQGVRVANPTQGLYIVRQGNKVSKQIIR